jgi:hypothetical protein
MAPVYMAVDEFDIPQQSSTLTVDADGLVHNIKVHRAKKFRTLACPSDYSIALKPDGPWLRSFWIPQGDGSGADITFHVMYETPNKDKASYCVNELALPQLRGDHVCSVDADEGKKVLVRTKRTRLSTSTTGRDILVCTSGHVIAAKKTGPWTKSFRISNDDNSFYVMTPMTCNTSAAPKIVHKPHVGFALYAQREEHGDVVLRRSDDAFRVLAHKSVLAAQVPYFGNLMSGRWTVDSDEEGRAIFTMPETVTELALSVCLKYVYTNELPDSTEVAADDDVCCTIMLADEWELDAVVQSLAARVTVPDVSRAVALLTRWPTVVNHAAMVAVKKRALQLTRNNVTDAEVEEALFEVARKRARK